jgi:hypothetical protein
MKLLCTAVWRIAGCHGCSVLMWPGTHPEFFLLGGGGRVDPDGVYNLCLIMRIVLQKSCFKYNVALSETVFVYIRI